MTEIYLAPLPDDTTGSHSERQRLDKWLWFARVVKTRTLASRLVQDGHVRLNGQRIDTPAKPVAPGAVLTIALDREIKILRVLAPGSRRGPYEEARLLYEDLTPTKERDDQTGSETDAAAPSDLRKPSQQERRAHARLTGKDWNL